MIIKCPQCSATYDVPSASAVQGRKVRCTRCAHVWRAEVIEGETGKPAAAAPPTAAPANKPYVTASVPQTAQLGQPVAQESFVKESFAKEMAAPAARPEPALSAASASAAAATLGRQQFEDDGDGAHHDHEHRHDQHRHDQNRHDQERRPAGFTAPARTLPPTPSEPPRIAPPRPTVLPAPAPAQTNGNHAGMHGLNGADGALAQPSPRGAPDRGTDRMPDRTLQERPLANGSPSVNQAGGDPFWAKKDAWDEVEQSLGKVTGSSRAEQRPAVEDRSFQQPPAPRRDRDDPPTRARPALAQTQTSAPAASSADSEWAAARGPTTQSRAPIANRPGLDDEGFWRDRTTPAAAPPAWPQVDDGTDGAEGGDPGRHSAGTVMAAVGWVLFAAIVAGLMTFLYVGRTQVVRALPGAAPLYASAGMPVNIRGLEFRDVSYKWGIDRKGRPAMTIAGKVVNITDRPQTVPSVAFVFLDKDKAELFNWATPIRDTPLQPGKMTGFEAKIPAPPEAVANLQLRFAKTR